MDLLEIRKKAKGLKDAAQEETAPAAAESTEAEKAGGTKAEGPAKAGGRRGTRKKRSAPRKALSEAAVAVEEAPSARPETAAGDGEEKAAEVAEPCAAAEETAAHEGGLPPAEGTGQPADADGGPARQEDADEMIEYLAFMLADEEYAVKVEDIKEIIRPQRTTSVPRTPGFVVGIISLRGVILPVFNIKKRLGFEDSGKKKATRIIIVSDGASPLGILVDRVTGVVKLKKSEIEPPPAVIGGVESEYLRGVGRQGERLLILFNTLKVLEMEGR